jgi:hypothetical protein
MKLKRIGSEDVYWIHLAKDKFQWQAHINTVMNRQVPFKSANFFAIWMTINFSSGTYMVLVTVKYKSRI